MKDFRVQISVWIPNIQNFEGYSGSSSTNDTYRTQLQKLKKKCLCFESCSPTALQWGFHCSLASVKKSGLVNSGSWFISLWWWNADWQFIYDSVYTHVHIYAHSHIHMCMQIQIETVYILPGLKQSWHNALIWSLLCRLNIPCFVLQGLMK